MNQILNTLGRSLVNSVGQRVFSALTGPNYDVEKASAEMSLQTYLGSTIKGRMRKNPKGPRRSRMGVPNVKDQMAELASYMVPGKGLVALDGSFHKKTLYMGWAFVASNYNIPLYLAHGSRGFGTDKMTEPYALLKTFMVLLKSGLLPPSGLHFLTDCEWMAKGVQAHVNRGEHLQGIPWKLLLFNYRGFLAKFLATTNSTIDYPPREKNKIANYLAYNAGYNKISLEEYVPNVKEEKEKLKRK